LKNFVPNIGIIKEKYNLSLRPEQIDEMMFLKIFMDINGPK